MLSESQLRWRCRRGVRELDVLFDRFLREEYQGLDDSGKSSFQRLLDVQDPIIMDWLFAKSKSDDPEIQSLVSRLQSLSGL